MIEKVKLNEVMNAWPEADSLEKIVGMNAGSGSTLAQEKMLSAQNIAGSNFSGDGGMKHASIKYLGRKKGDAIASVLLVSEYNDNKLENLRGIIGRLYTLRGNSAAILAANFTDVECLRAYNNFKLTSSNGGLKAGRCVYGGKNYLAIKLGSASYFDVFFTGIYSGNCNFVHVLESDVAWIG